MSGDVGPARKLPTSAEVIELLGGFNRKGGGPRGPGAWRLMTEEVLYPATDEIFRHDVVGFRRNRLAECPSAFPERELPDWACEVHRARPRGTTS